MKIEFQKQFTGARTQGGDCGPTALIHMFHFVTDNEFSPTQTEIREKGNITEKPHFATNMDDLKGAWDAMGLRARKIGWELGNFQVQYNAPRNSLMDCLAGGKGAILFVNYKTWNDLLPKKSGDVDFDGMHAIFVAPEFQLNHSLVLVYDGLCDGRKDMPSGVTAPRGPQWVPWEKLMRCASDYTSGAGITYAVSRKGERLAGEKPSDHDECKKKLKLTEQLMVEQAEKMTRLLNERQALEDLVARLKGGSDDIRLMAQKLIADIAATKWKNA